MVDLAKVHVGDGELQIMLDEDSKFVGRVVCDSDTCRLAKAESATNREASHLTKSIGLVDAAAPDPEGGEARLGRRAHERAVGLAIQPALQLLHRHFVPATTEHGRRQTQHE